MPRNGSGTYTLPAGNPVVTGTVISSTVHNNTMSDIADELTNSVDKDGQTVITGDIDFNGNAIILDVDGDSKIVASTDDRFDLTLGGVLSLSLTSAQAILLDDIANLTPTDSNIIVGNGTTFVAESGSTARQSLGVDLTTKGSVLAGNGTAPAPVTVGANGTVLTANSGETTGVEWAVPAAQVTDYQEFTSSDTWTKPANVTSIYIEAIGGGGGGGSNGGGQSGGGGGGGFSFKHILASDAGATETVTIGAGGAAGSSGNGGTGGDTTFGSLLTAYGGLGGSGSAATGGLSGDYVPIRTGSWSSGGGGGASDTSAGGSCIKAGAGGGVGGSAGDSSAGGASREGGAGGAGTVGGAGVAGTAPGGGGGGGSGAGGGAGGAGRVRVWAW